MHIMADIILPPRFYDEKLEKWQNDRVTNHFLDSRMYLKINGQILC